MGGERPQGVDEPRALRELDDHDLPALDGDMPLDPLQLRSTIERQGGKFSVETPSSVHGMRYVIELPLRAVDADAPSSRVNGVLNNSSDRKARKIWLAACQLVGGRKKMPR